MYLKLQCISTFYTISIGKGTEIKKNTSNTYYNFVIRVNTVCYTYFEFANSEYIQQTLLSYITLELVILQPNLYPVLSHLKSLTFLNYVRYTKKACTRSDTQ